MRYYYKLFEITTIKEERFLSLKTDIEMVKDELTSEEKFFEKAVVTEKFIKKYKNLLIGGAVLVAVGLISNAVYTVMENNRIESANKALAQLQKDPKNTKALNELKSSSPVLFDVWNFSVSVANDEISKLKSLKNSKALIVPDLASYEVASLENNQKELSNYASQQNAIFKELALIQAAIILIQENKIEQAHDKLRMINELSPMYKVAKALLHYGVK